MGKRASRRRLSVWRAAVALALFGAPRKAGAALQVEIRVDPRTELVEVVHLLALPRPEGNWVQYNDSRYAEEVRARFSAYRSHPAVAAYREAFAAGLDIHHILQESATGLSRDRLEVDESVYPKSQPTGKLLALLSDFARDARFMEFFQDHRALYERYATLFAAEMKGLDYVPIWEQYTGLKVDDTYTVFIMPFMRKTSSYCECPSGPCHILTFWGPENGGGKEPDFGYRHRADIIFHEIGHPIVDKWSVEYEAAVDTLKPAGFVESSCFGSWGQCVRDNVVQSLADRVLVWGQENGKIPPLDKTPLGAKQHHPDLGDDQLLYEKNLIKRLREFERDRSHYASLKDFYPKLLEAFAEPR